MQADLSDIYFRASRFLSTIKKKLHEVGLDPYFPFIDHICYRVATVERYFFICDQLIASGNKLLRESIINGRSIAVFEMSSPFRFDGLAVDILEVPAPKSVSYYPEGFEHAEVVLQEDFHSFMQAHDDLSFDTSGVNKSHNPELRLTFDELSVKFHHQTLARIVALENEQESK